MPTVGAHTRYHVFTIDVHKPALEVPYQGDVTDLVHLSLAADGRPGILLHLLE